MKRKTILTMMFLLVFVLVLGACSNGNQNAKNEEVSTPSTPSTSTDKEVNVDPKETKETKDEPFAFSIMLQNNPHQEIDDVLPLVEEYTNTKLDVRFTADLQDVLPVAMAAGDLPDVISSWWIREPYMVSAMRGGVVWDITDYIKDYPNLSAIHPQIYENMSLDGRTYGIPRVRPMARVTIIYRKDWLENLGMSEPTTIDEYYEMLRAFTFDDPDKNGQDDTIGLAESGTANVHRLMSIVHGAPNYWAEDNGKFTATHETEEFLNSLKFMNRLYEEELMNRDFPVLNENQKKELFQSGKAGAYVRHIDEAYLFQPLMPDAKLGVISQFEGPDGIRRTTGETGAGSILMFTKTGFPTEEDLRKGLEFFDALGDEEMANLFAWGIEGKHYEVVDGKAQMIDSEGYAKELEHFRNQLMARHPSDNKMEGNVDELTKYGEALKEDNIQYAVFDPTLALLSETFAERGSQLNTIVDDALTKFILGEIDEAGWHTEVERWREAGGTQVAEEYATAFAKANN